MRLCGRGDRRVVIVLGAIILLARVHVVSARESGFFGWLPSVLTSDATPAHTNGGAATSQRRAPSFVEYDDNVSAGVDSADNDDDAIDDDDDDDDDSYASRAARRAAQRSSARRAAKRVTSSSSSSKKAAAAAAPRDSTTVMQNVQFAGATMVVMSIGLAIIYKTVGFAGSIAMRLITFIPLYVLCRFLEWSLLSTLHRFEPLLRIMTYFRV